MKDLVFCGGIVHNLIVRQAESLCQNVMEFNFNGKGATFTEKEFGVITGLNMDASFDTLPPPTSNRIRNKYFGASNKVKNANLLMVFNGLRSKDLEEEDDMVKLCLLYVLECDILGKESQSTIKLDNFSMVEDLEYFNQYPWELDSYNATMVSLHKVWGYETIPLLGQLYARKMDDAFPRIYNWESRHYHSDHEGNVLDATNLQVDADDENPHHQFSVNEGDSEVQFVTP
ncbi:hypothetical protein FNV43_RR12491 [Rhamnella rubrinervis]|uniref:DUF1985 domain-containing protein n=1 Tax=Rhamnella rubrinervis TaxID=2594499 RepID=A0A8K0MIP3_9ROSA|nr:hypothetical protein FNV43_RR12491 [Rhamnella rubrinervis]